jgi:hypothetical protein
MSKNYFVNYSNLIISKDKRDLFSFSTTATFAVAIFNDVKCIIS